MDRCTITAPGSPRRVCGSQRAVLVLSDNAAAAVRYYVLVADARLPAGLLFALSTIEDVDLIHAHRLRDLTAGDGTQSTLRNMQVHEFDHLKYRSGIHERLVRDRSMQTVLPTRC